MASGKQEELNISLLIASNVSNITDIINESVFGEAQDLLLILKFVQRMKGSKRKTIFKKAANLGA